MAYKIQSSFSAGELDPALHERTTFDKYQSGLKTLRNANIGKSGRITSRPGTKLYRAARYIAPFSDGTFTANVNNICTKANHGLTTGAMVTCTTTGTLPLGLSLATYYYIMVIDANTFYFASSLIVAETNVGADAVDIQDVGSGVHSIVSQEEPGCVLYSPPYTQYLIEWGHRYVRIHNTDAGTYATTTHNFTSDDMYHCQFTYSGYYVYITRKGVELAKLVLGDLVGADPLLAVRFVTNNYVLFRPSAPTFFSTNFNATGYLVEYAFTYVENGQESAPLYNSGTPRLPILAGEANEFVLTRVTYLHDATELRAYRRPKNGGAYGFIGSSTVTVQSSSFTDYGGDADYTHTLPENSFIPGDPTAALVFPKPAAACIYQQKLLLTSQFNTERIDASRTGYQNNFYRDFPIAADSALTFKMGSAGNAQVLRMIDNNGLLVFTTVGIFRNQGALTPENLYFEKKGSWVIDDALVPLEVPGAVFIVDRSTNTVRTIINSQEAEGFVGEEISIFSNHLLIGKTIISWAFHEGDVPVVWMVMSDGSMTSITYQREHQMQAWSRHDTDGEFESVAVVKDLATRSVPYFLVKRGEKRYIESLTDRTLDEHKEYVLMDSAVVFNSEISSGASVTAVPATDWEGLLTLTSDVAIFTNTADNGAVGTVFRFFDSDGSAVDLTVTTYTSTTSVVVQPSVEFPSEQATDIKLFKTYSTLTGLDHLNGKMVSIMVDGYVVASPNNDVNNYPEITVMGGHITLPDEMRGAYIQVGLPYTVDIETLDIDTVEQKPVLLESNIVQKVYVKVYQTRGIYVGARFAEGESVQGMSDPDEMTEDLNTGNIGNAAQKPITKRHDIVIDNDWQSNGRICIRQVDPLPLEILSIIPDMTTLY